jgi:NADPH:quinone reductase-like Zn-dependent oxidoreductase
MATMKVMRVRKTGAGLALVAEQAEVPAPAPHEVLVRVHAAGVTTTELQWYPTTHTAEGAERTGAVPGHEFSGVVHAVGADLDGALLGREVYGMNDWFMEGATGEYCVAAAAGIATKPPVISHAEAASVPIGALTAWQGLFEKATLERGQRVLIHGAAGGVGVYAVQLARRTGARVIATGAGRSEAFLKDLGAEVFVDYEKERFEERVPEMGRVDVVFDCVGGETLRRSWRVLKEGGRMVTIAAESEGDEKAKGAFFIVEANGAQLGEIAGLIERGELRVILNGTVKLEDAEAAYLRNAGRERGRGKVVVSVIGD